MVVSDLKKEPSHWISTGSRAYLHFKIVYPVDLMNETLVPSIILISLSFFSPPVIQGRGVQWITRYYGKTSCSQITLPSGRSSP